jgi:hypothetical protein
MRLDAPRIFENGSPFSHQEAAMPITPRTITALALIATLAACGGGDDAPVKDFSGTYAVQAAKVSDNCGTMPPYNGADHTVTNEPSIRVRFNTADLNGYGTPEGGFTAFSYKTTGNAYAEVKVTYTPTDKDGVYSLLMTTDVGSSVVAFRCTSSYIGTATKR